MPTPHDHAVGHRPVSVLVITSDPWRLPAVPAGALWSLTALVPTGRTDVPAGYAVETLDAEAPADLRGRVRLGTTAARSVQTAVRGRACVGWVWALKRGTPRLRELVREHDVVVVDPVTKRVLDRMPGLVGPGTALMGTEDLQDVLGVWGDLALVRARALDQEDAAPVDDLAARVAGWRVDRLPASLRLSDVVTEVVREHRECTGLLEGSEVSYVLDGIRYPCGGGGLDGQRARWLSAALTLGHLRPEDDEGGEIDDVVAGTLAAADGALAQGDEERALDLLTDGMTLMFHRGRHAETVSSPLVEDPTSFLAPLRTNRTFTDLLRRRRDREARGEPARDRAPRVLVMGGSYGNFHGPVADALEGLAEVRVRDLGRGHLGRTVLTPETLPRLAQLLATRDGAPRLGQEPLDELDDRAEDLLGHLRWADVVWTDWADPATVWLSHLCPWRVRLVLRVHGVDALEPWIHLIRWNRVDRVVVVSEPMRSLVEDVLAGMGVSVPVVVLANLLADPAGLDRPKVDDAGTTLGLVGWGREVKDPLWALRLLGRDPSWRLVLVGPGFPDPPAPHQAAYVGEVDELLASPDLAGRVILWGQTDDVGEALRHVGVILSSSRRESWHMGLVEGALSRAVPVVRSWPLLADRGGPRALFPDAWVVDDLDAAEARVRHVSEPTRWEAEGSAARRAALELFHPEQTAEAYRELLRGLLAPEH